MKINRKILYAVGIAGAIFVLYMILKKKKEKDAETPSSSGGGSTGSSGSGGSSTGSSGSGSGSSSQVANIDVNRRLSTGSTGAEVKVLQKGLNDFKSEIPSLSYATLSVDGNFGQLTKAALLEATGEDNATLEELNQKYKIYKGADAGFWQSLINANLNAAEYATSFISPQSWFSWLF